MRRTVDLIGRAACAALLVVVILVIAWLTVSLVVEGDQITMEIIGAALALGAIWLVGECVLGFIGGLRGKPRR